MQWFKKGDILPPDHDDASPININIASHDELNSLPGIGISKAKRILAYRERVGTFSRIEDIELVSGIGTDDFERIKDSICVT